MGAGRFATTDATPLRRATVAHQAETFLLEMLSAGYTIEEIEAGFRASLDRWRAVTAEVPPRTTDVLRFAGSNDPAVSLLAARFGQICDCTLQVVYPGSIGGLIALAEGAADLAGSHLWDEESDSYNEPFVRRLLPGRRVALLTLAHRALGLVTKPGALPHVTDLRDLAKPDLRFINRQRGAGTRVWLDAQLWRAGMDPAGIVGYDLEVNTHAEVARAVAQGEADAGLAIETAAIAYGLQFVRLATEPYDLVIPEESWELPSVKALANWLRTDDAHGAIAALGGYDTKSTGAVGWVEPQHPHG